MRIGISFLPTSRVAVHLGEALRRVGWMVDLIAVGKDKWFTDCSAGEWNVVGVGEVAEVYDIFIDTIGNINSVIRRRLGQRVVLFIDEDITMSLRENIIYEKDRRVFGWEGADEVWTWRASSVEAVRVLSKLPVRSVPFYWSPFHLSDLEEYTCSEGELNLHLIGSNKSISSSTIQSMILCNDLANVIVHNTEGLVESVYFKNNVKPSLPRISYEGAIDLKAALKQNTCIVSNLRFVEEDSLAAVRELLDYVWLGFPVVHNSRWLRDFGHGYENLYYDDCSTLEAALGHVAEGWTCLRARRDALEKVVSSLEGWDCDYSSSEGSAKKMVIQFSDFWENFNPEYNFFTLLFTEALGLTCRVVGVGEAYDGRADLVICGPYSERWRGLDATIPKICFTGELSQPVYGNGIFLNIGFFANGYGLANTGVNYCRFPLWAASINWFGADNARLVNPTLIDIDDCLRSHTGTAAREKFCAFVVSNPSNPIRNEAFKTLNAYKHVDSAGALFNNMGSGLFAGAGGGGGERRKVEFLRDYRFALVYENNSWSGYTTEKLFHAKVAGCLPLYWGDPIAAQDFDPHGYINLTNKEGDLLDIVKALEEAPEEIDRRAALPALTMEKMDTLRSSLAAIVKYTMDHVYPAEKKRWLADLPHILGARSSAEAAEMAARRLEQGLEMAALEVSEFRTPEFGEKIRKMLFVVYAQKEDMGDLYLWLSHTNTMALASKAEYIIYYNGAASKQLEYIIKMYPWVRIVATIADKQSVMESLSRTHEERRLICYMSPRVVLVNNPYYMCCVAEQHGVCRLRWRDRLVEGTAEPAPMDDFMIFKAGVDLSIRVQMIKADSFIGFDNMESARASGKAAYCWLSKFKYKAPFLEGITDCSIINLKRRPDRLMRFVKHHGAAIADKITIVDAVDGRRLKLTPAIQRLFEGGNFGWKKGVIGCNLSHLKLWYGLVHSNQFCENLLVLEDDVRFEEGWESRLVEAMKVAPADYDLLYLGGVLPKNRSMWEECHENVNAHWAKIKKNTIFGQEQIYFHYCTYSYIITKRGAEKLLEGIQITGGFKNVVDHQMLNPQNKLNIYIINPLLSGCYQDDDENYQKTDFNSNQPHNFDSDLWNNTDYFTPDFTKRLAHLDVAKVIEDLKYDNKSEDYFLEGISECSLINLKRRSDRLKRFEKNHGAEILNKIKVIPAFDGKELKITPHIKSLFKDNTFNWKKGVIGCNLSHLSEWYRLYNSNTLENLMILEDDARFQDGWQEKLVEAMRSVPKDYDILYLGGILPPNKKLYNECKIKVNDYWDYICKNTFFTKTPEPFFHFCAYSYILSKSGAEKIINGIYEEGSYVCVSDHQLLRNINSMKIYIINPNISGCYQEDDPVYIHTNFNSTQKEHTYDSDLWTSSDCFDVQDVADVPLNIENALADAQIATCGGSSLSMVAVSPPIITLAEESANTYEKEWLSNIIGFPLEDFGKGSINNLKTSSHAIIVYREKSEEEVQELIKMIDYANKNNKKLIVIHLSDETCDDDISFYEEQCITLIIRNYIKNDINQKYRNKVLTIPLGYYRRADDSTEIPRSLLWSFHGSDYGSRKKMVATLKSIEPHSIRLRTCWEAEGTSREEYLTDLSASVFVPCPEGIAAESFRIYECLEAGCIPILVDEGRSKGFYPWIQSALPSIIVARSWESALRVFADWKADPSALVARHAKLINEWEHWKEHLRGIVRKFVFWA